MSAEGGSALIISLDNEGWPTRERNAPFPSGARSCLQA